MANKNFIYDIIVNVKENVSKQLDTTNRKFDTLFSGTKIGQFKDMAVDAFTRVRAAIGLVGVAATAIVGSIVAIGAAMYKVWEANRALNKELSLLKTQFSDLSKGDLIKFNAQIRTMGDTFNAEAKDITNAAKALSKNLKVGLPEALKLIEEGFLKGADAQGEYLDSLKEYSSAIKNAGISAKQFNAILIEGATQGVFTDKLIDGLKEFNLKIKDQAKATVEAMQPLGEAFSKDLLEGVKNGTITSTEAIVKLESKIKSLSLTTQEQQKLTTALFGAIGEDLGGVTNALTLYKNGLDNANKPLNEAQKLQQKEVEALAKNKEALDLLTASLKPFSDLVQMMYIGLLNLATSTVRGIASLISDIDSAGISVMKFIDGLVGITRTYGDEVDKAIVKTKELSEEAKQEVEKKIKITYVKGSDISTVGVPASKAIPLPTIGKPVGFDANNKEISAMNAHRRKLAEISNGIAQDSIKAKLDALNTERSMEDTKLEDLQTRKGKEMEIIKEGYKAQISEANLAAEEMLRNAAGKNWGEAFSKAERGAAMKAIKEAASKGDATAMSQLETINAAYAKSSALKKQQDSEVANLKKGYDKESLGRVITLNEKNVEIAMTQADQDILSLQRQKAKATSLEEELEINNKIKKVEAERLAQQRIQRTATATSGTDIGAEKAKFQRETNDKIALLDKQKKAFEEVNKAKIEANKSLVVDKSALKNEFNKREQERQDAYKEASTATSASQMAEFNLKNNKDQRALDEAQLAATGTSMITKLANADLRKQLKADIDKSLRDEIALAQEVANKKTTADKLVAIYKNAEESAKKASEALNSVGAPDVAKITTNLKNKLEQIKAASGIDVDVNTLMGNTTEQIKQLSETKIQATQAEIDQLKVGLANVSTATLQEIADAPAKYGVELATKAKQALADLSNEQNKVLREGYDRDIETFANYLKQKSNLLQRQIDRENFLETTTEQRQKDKRKKREAQIKEALIANLKAYDFSAVWKNIQSAMQQGFITEKAIMKERLSHLQQVKSKSEQLAIVDTRETLIRGSVGSGDDLATAKAKAESLIKFSRDTTASRAKIEGSINRKLSDDEYALVIEMQNKILAANKDFSDKRKEIYMTDTELRWDRTRRLFEKIGEVGQTYVNVVGQIFDVMNQYTQSKIDDLANKITELSDKLAALGEMIKESEDKVKGLEDTVNESRGKKRLDSIEMYNSEREKLLALKAAEAGAMKQKLDFEKEQKSLDNDMKKRAETMATLNQIIATTSMVAAAAGAIKNAQTAPFPANLVAMALSMSAIVSTFATAKSLFKFEKGGVVPTETGGMITGERHSKGGVQFEAEGGEYIFSREATKRIGISRLNEMNFSRSFGTDMPKRKFDTGGLVGATQQAGIDSNSELANKLDSLIMATESNFNKPSYVTVQDIRQETNKDNVRIKSTRF